MDITRSTELRIGVEKSVYCIDRLQKEYISYRA